MRALAGLHHHGHLCAHHAREHRDRLREIAALLHDETYKLAETPATAPDEEG